MNLFESGVDYIIE